MEVLLFPEDCIIEGDGPIRSAPEGQRALPGHPEHTYEVIRAADHYAVLVRKDDTIVQRGVFAKGFWWVVSPQPGHDLGAVAAVARSLCAVLATQGVAYCEFVTNTTQTTPRFAPGSIRVITDGVVETHRRYSLRDDDRPWEGSWLHESFVISAATYAVCVATLLNQVSRLYLWEGVDVAKVIAAIKGLPPRSPR